MTDLPICADRWCKNKARFRARIGRDAPMEDVCGTHRRVWDRERATDDRHEAYRVRREAENAAESLAVNLSVMLGEALTRAYGDTIVFSTDGKGAVTLDVDTAKTLLGHVR